jgi:hypothetical protein
LTEYGKPLIAGGQYGERQWCMKTVNILTDFIAVNNIMLSQAGAGSPVACACGA